MQLRRTTDPKAAGSAGAAARRSVGGSPLQQRVVRVASGLLACLALVNILTFMKTMGVLTASDVLQATRRSSHQVLHLQQRLRADDYDSDAKPVAVNRDTWETLLAAADASAAGSTAQQLQIHYTARTRATHTEDAWRAVNGDDVAIHYYSDDDSEALVRARRPQFLETYRAKLSPVERADYFRYLVLWAHGGVYVDSDIQFITSVNKWLSTFGWDVAASTTAKRQLPLLDVVVGVEFPSPQTQHNHTGWLPLQVTQFVIAGAKDSEVLARVLAHIEHCVATIDRGDDVEMTIQRTGPAAFTRAILDAIEARGVVAPAVEEMHTVYASDARYPRALLPVKELEKTGQLIPWRRSGTHGIGNVLVLPYRAFAYHQFHKIADAPVLTKHLFHNSWRDKKN